MDALKSLGPVKWRVPEAVIQAACRGEHAGMLTFIEALQKAWIERKGSRPLAGSAFKARHQISKLNKPNHNLNVTCQPSAMSAVRPSSPNRSNPSRRSPSRTTSAVDGNTYASQAIRNSQSKRNNSVVSSPEPRESYSLRQDQAERCTGSPQRLSWGPRNCELNSNGDECAGCPLSNSQVLEAGCSQATAAREETYGRVTSGSRPSKTRSSGVRPEAARPSRARSCHDPNMQHGNPSSEAPHASWSRGPTSRSPHARSASPQLARKPPEEATAHRPGASKNSGLNGTIGVNESTADGVGIIQPGAGRGTRTLGRMRSMSAPGGSQKVNAMLKGSTPDERALRSWLADKGVKVVLSQAFSASAVVLEQLQRSQLLLCDYEGQVNM